jgi:hypothetical protein
MFDILNAASRKMQILVLSSRKRLFDALGRHAAPNCGTMSIGCYQAGLTAHLRRHGLIVDYLPTPDQSCGSYSGTDVP